MATHASVGWIDTDEELNSIYIRKDSYVAPGQLGTYNSATGSFDLLPPGTNGYVLSADSLSTYGLTWVPAPNEDIQAGTSGAESGASGLTITTPAPNITTLALANSGVVPNTYGSSTVVPVITIDARGRITSATTAPVAPAVDPLASIPIRNWKAGSFSVVSVSDGVAVGDTSNAAVQAVSVGSASSAGVEGVAAGYQAAAPLNSVAVGKFSGNAASTGQRNVYIGRGAVDKLNADVDLVSIGHQASAGNQSVAVGSSTSALAECVVAGFDADTFGIHSVSLGHSSQCGSSECVSVGWEAGSAAISGVSCTFVGAQAYGGAGFNFQTSLGAAAGCSGEAGTAVGAGARAGRFTVCINGFAEVEQSTVCGTLSVAGGNNTQIFGYNNRGGTSVGNVILGLNSGHNGLLGGSTSNLFAGSNVVSGVLTTGVSNTFLGSNISVSGAAVSNAVAVGAGITNVASNTISIGLLSSASALDSISVGRSSAASGADSMALMRSSIASNQYAIAAGLGAQATNIDSLAICRGAVSSAQGAIVIGQGATTVTPALGSIVLGSGADSAALAQVVIGRNAHGNANADAVVIIGDGASSTTNSIAAISIGRNSAANQSRCITIGDGLINNEANTSLIGYDLTHISKFTGFVKSYRSMSCAVGLIETEPSQLYNAGTGVVQRLNLVSTRYNFGGMNIDLVNNEVQLGNFPDDNGSTFHVSLMIDGTADLPSAVFRFRIMWLAPGFTAPGGNRVAVANCETTLTTLLTNTTITTDINVPPGSASPNLVWCDVTRLSPIGELTVTAIRFTVSRNA